MIDPVLSRRLGDVVGVVDLDPAVREAIVSAAEENETWDQLPPGIRALVESLEVASTQGPRVLRPMEAEALTAAKRGPERWPAGTPGDEFEEYWTRGPGLSRWVGSAHPFTTLVNLLKEHLKVAAKPGFAERLAATYFKKVKGYWPSERQGTNPVGPG